MNSLDLLSNDELVTHDGSQNYGIPTTYSISNQGVIFYKKIIYKGVLFYLNDSSIDVISQSDKIKTKDNSLYYYFVNTEFPITFQNITSVIIHNAIPFVKLLISIGSGYFKN